MLLRNCGGAFCPPASAALASRAKQQIERAAIPESGGRRKILSAQTCCVLWIIVLCVVKRVLVHNAGPRVRRSCFVRNRGKLVVRSQLYRNAQCSARRVTHFRHQSCALVSRSAGMPPFVALLWNRGLNVCSRSRAESYVLVRNLLGCKQLFLAQCTMPDSVQDVLHGIVQRA